MRWPEGPPHLALNPPYFFSFLNSFGGFKDQVRWPKGPPHSALNPPIFFFFGGGGLLLFLSFLCFVMQKKLVFPLEKAIICLFLNVSLCLALAFCGLPLFQFFFLCLSLLLVLFSFPSCLSFLLSFASLFLSLSFLFFSVFFMKNNIKISNYKVFLHQYFLFFGFLSSSLFEIPSLIFFC